MNKEIYVGKVILKLSSHAPLKYMMSSYIGFSGKFRINITQQPWNTWIGYIVAPGVMIQTKEFKLPEDAGIELLSTLKFLLNEISSVI
jgi:hypothetical protein